MKALKRVVMTALLLRAVAPLARDWGPQLVLVSAGFDAHVDDPLAGCVVTDAGYATMAASVRRLADAAGAPVGVVLEGGYELGALTRGLRTTLQTVALAPRAAPALAEHPLARAALERARALMA